MTARNAVALLQSKAAMMASYHRPEMLRIRGELLLNLKEANRQSAEADFRNSMLMAHTIWGDAVSGLALSATKIKVDKSLVP
jgi:hypothetical protein